MSMNDMQNDLKRILDHLARRKKDSADIRELDNELIGSCTPHSELFNLFIKQQELSLSETMASLMTEETDNGRLLIEGYRENYMNEIIQNINDLDIDIKSEEDKSVEISVVKQGDSIVLTCTYRDDGFRAKDVYGFCNTGKGAKTEDQDGKFGIGIKAILAATSYFEVRSNLVIKYPDEGGSASITDNSDWDHIHTYAKYIIPAPDESGYYNGIHVGKLENIIDSADPKTVFSHVDYEHLLFDFRSLLFMKRIRRIGFNEWIISCEEECYGEDSEAVSEMGVSHYAIKQVMVRRNTDDAKAVLNERYLCWIPDKEYFGRNEMAFLLTPVEDGEAVPNRLYSVYYIRELADTIKPLGILINTDHVNSFRNEIASTEEEIKSIKKEIKELVSKTIALWTVNPFDDTRIQTAVSKIFFRCLLSYWSDIEDGFRTVRENDKADMDEIFGLFNCVLANGFTVQNLTKILGAEQITQKYVIDKEDVEEYEKFFIGVEDESVAGETKELYLNTFEKDEVITFSQIIQNGISSDVIKVYEKVRSTDTEELINMLNWFGSVADFVKYVILDGNREDDDISMEELASFIKKFRENHTDKETSVLRKILGRYKIHPLFSETGRVRAEKVNFIDYLYADEDEDELLKEIYAIYDNKYLAVKKRLRGNLCSLNYAVPYGPSLRRWDGDCATRIIPMSSSNASINCSDAGLIFDIIDKQDLYTYVRKISGDGYYPTYYVLNKQTWRSFKISWKDYQNQHRYLLKAINLSKIVQCCSFGIDEFVKYQHVLDRISGSQIDGSDNYLTGDLFVRVREGNIHVNKLADLILWMTKWFNIGGRNNTEARHQAIEIESVDCSDSYNECGQDYIEFVNNITSGVIKDIYLRRIDTGNHGARMTAYAGAGKELNIRLKKSENYRNLYRSRILNDDSRLFVFYSNQSKEEALSDVIDNLDLGADITEQIKGYISVAEIGHSVSSFEYERKLQQSQYTGNTDMMIVDGKVISDKQATLSVKDKKKLLMARGSYNGCCPVCRKPLIGEDNDLDKAVKNSYLYTLKLDDGTFFQSCCCPDCLAILRKTYMGACLSGNVLKLRQTIVSGEKETSDNDMEILLSNINVLLRGIDT